MNIAALISGGKDSIYAAYKAYNEGHSMKYLVGIESKNPDSYMYHVPNIELTKKIAEAMDIPIRYVVTEGEREKELKELREVLNGIEEEVSGVVSGALASNYQRKRVGRICDDLNLKSITPLWHVDEDKYMEEFVEKDFEVIITSVSAGGLNKSWLGRKIDGEALEDLKKIRKDYRIHLAGEGGEYETLVIDCPLYNKKIEIKDFSIKWENSRGKLEIEEVDLTRK